MKVWHILAKHPKKIGSASRLNLQYGEMQMSMNELLAEGYDKFDIWSEQKP